MDELLIQFGELQPDLNDDLPIAFGDDVNIVQPPSKPKKRRVMSGGFAVTYSGSLNTNLCHTQHAVGKQLAAPQSDDISGSLTVQTCFQTSSAKLFDLQTCQQHEYGISTSLYAYNDSRTSETLLHHVCSHELYGVSLLRIGVSLSAWAGVFRKGCQGSAFTGKLLGRASDTDFIGKTISSCLKTQIGDSMQPPCYWYEIVLPDKITEVKSLCGKNPPSDELPLAFELRQTETDAAQISLPFACRAVSQIPVLDSYMILNKISASVNGEPLTILAASVKADMSGYCWQGSVQVAPQDFDYFGFATKQDLPISLTINGETFVFMGENVSDSRRFADKSFTVSGRSLTAKLGADYAKNQAGKVNQALMVRQIVDAQLRYTDFKLGDWDAENWRIPADVFVLTDKTPIGVMQELAAAAGAFVESHPSDLILNVKPRWKRPAWEMSDGADVVCPPNVVREISGQKQVSTQFNSVLIAPTHQLAEMALVYRDGSDKLPAAPSVSGSLYTSSAVCRAAAVAILSESGTHKDEQVTLAPPSEKYAIGRAKLGEIWRFDEPDGAWWGVITGVELRMAMTGDVAEVWQVLSVDRYLGD